MVPWAQTGREGEWRWGAAGVEILWVRVRTRGKDGRPRTVCELELASEDVWQVMTHVGPPY